MDVDLENLTMVNRKKADSETCPKCDAGYPAGATECPNYGVLFGKVKSPAPPPPKDDPAVRPPPRFPEIKEYPIDRRKESRHIPCWSLSPFFCRALIICTPPSSKAHFRRKTFEIIWTNSATRKSGCLRLEEPDFHRHQDLRSWRGRAFMTEGDYEAMVKAVSDKTIAEYVQSMDVRQ